MIEGLGTYNHASGDKYIGEWKTSQVDNLLLSLLSSMLSHNITVIPFHLMIISVMDKLSICMNTVESLKVFSRMMREMDQVPTIIISSPSVYLLPSIVYPFSCWILSLIVLYKV